VNTKEILIKCVDCKHFPNSCGYWGSKYRKHTCSGFVPAEEMNLKDTLYALSQMDIRQVRCNSQVVNRAIKYIKQGENYKEKINILMSRENPYSEDIFIPISKEDFAKINDLLKKKMGYPIDRLSGCLGRELYKSIIETLKEMLDENN
jgi:hypothetical protein